MTRRGGHLCFSVRTDVDAHEGFQEHTVGLEAAGTWQAAHVSGPFQWLPRSGPEVQRRVFAHRVL